MASTRTSDSGQEVASHTRQAKHPGTQNLGSATSLRPRRRFGHIHIDVVRPLPQLGRASSTRYSEAIPMEEASTVSCAEALLSSWISHFRVLDNGMIERAHCSLKAALMARCINERWKEQLPWVLLGLCTAPKANGNASPAEKVYWKTLAIPGEFFLPSTNGADTPLPRLRELAQKFKPCHKTFTDRTTTYSPPALQACAYVFVRVDTRRPPLARLYRGSH
ncbi:uncharacterized protein [Macrobrachium rosenbergii]|uniref:uncharacterized protein n=1 Tax=Macrobrachium rosenbergii TaxID=79674 RepID=UPI0034D5B1A9